MCRPGSAGLSSWRASWGSAHTHAAIQHAASTVHAQLGGGGGGGAQLQVQPQLNRGETARPAAHVAGTPCPLAGWPFLMAVSADRPNQQACQCTTASEDCIDTHST